MRLSIPSWLLLLILVPFAVACDDDDKDDADDDDDMEADLQPLDCEIAIIGGGAAGTYAAYKLTAMMGDDVCLFEKEAYLGGRYRDIAMDGTINGDGPSIGTGARRVMETQEFVFALARELKLTLEAPEEGTNLIQARGTFSYSKDDFLPLYPGIMGPLDMDPDTDRETEMYNAIMDGPMRANVGNYPDLRSYIRAVVGEQGFNFLRDMSRFRADFDYPNDARGYMDYLDEEWDTCCAPQYPQGGMHSFTAAMEDKINLAMGRIFKSEPVLELRHDGSAYRLITPTHSVHANRVIVAAPPTGFDHITGDVAEAIQMREEYRALAPIRVTVINQWWPSNWWEQVRNPMVTEGQAQTWRAWSTDNCVNFIEIPLEPYATAQHVTRSVYNDDPDCTQLWEELYKFGGIDAVEDEVLRGLEYLFNNGVSAPMTIDIPEPVKTDMQIWPGAWYFLRAGTSVTNQQVADWSREPLPGEANLSMVGEAYWPRRSGWSHGAYRSVNHLLAAKYGIEAPVDPVVDMPMMQ